MNDDNKKIMILGMGLVGNSLLSLLVREQLLLSMLAGATFSSVINAQDRVGTVVIVSRKFMRNYRLINELSVRIEAFYDLMQSDQCE